MSGRELNLLDYEIENRPYRCLIELIGAGSLILTCMIMLFLLGVACSREKSQEVQLMNLQRRFDQLGPVSSPNLAGLDRRIEKKQKQLQNINDSHKKWTMILPSVEDLVPREVYIESIDAAERSMVIKGNAPGFSTFMKMVKSLSANPGFEKVRVKSAEEIDGEVHFEVVISI